MGSSALTTGSQNRQLGLDPGFGLSSKTFAPQGVKVSLFYFKKGDCL